ncbi:hypothetical protein OPT61_g10152 [Boeremia exigua]|uniref:Uncharacterized protein n=1 Tax=Boeremia exigua TaxID=749465 RepID=A0ACC2HRS7_9PLEO|nr:hypothetical protein OPT61_g10152 [Boeremia exigua]
MSFLPSLLQPKGPVLRNLEIRLDTPTVSVRRGGKHRVRGRVVFLNSSKVRVTSVTVSLTGVQQTLWHTDTMTADRIRSKDVIIYRERPIFPNQITNSDWPLCSIGAGNFVWPFEFDLGATPFESVSGLGGSFVNYEIRATLAFAGPFSKKLFARKQIRVVRSPCVEYMDDVEPEQEERGSWPDKLNYHVSVSPQHHLWGQPITARFRLHPATKGIAIESITLRLQESLLLSASSRDRELYQRREMTISEVEAIEEDNPALQSGLMLDTSGDAIEMILPLPKSVHLCRQSIRQGRIATTHEAFHKFPLVLTFPSGIAFDNNGLASIPSEHTPVQKDAQGLVTGLCAPPAFGKHRSDPIFRPGLYLPSREPCLGQTTHEAASEDEQHSVLRTRHLNRFVFPHVRDSHCQSEPAYPICLDRVPSYDTALRTPEVYSKDFDPSPRYAVDVSSG